MKDYLYGQPGLTWRCRSRCGHWNTAYRQ